MNLNLTAALWAATIALALSTASSATALTTSSEDDDGSALVYVPGTSGGITEINSANDVVFGTAPWPHGSSRWIPALHQQSRNLQRLGIRHRDQRADY